jgi:hypothetical protein
VPCEQCLIWSVTPKEFTMDHERVKGATDTTKGVVKNTSGKQAEPKFDKPLGSSHNDEVDLRDVARNAGEMSR